MYFLIILIYLCSFLYMSHVNQLQKGVCKVFWSLGLDRELEIRIYGFCSNPCCSLFSDFGKLLFQGG